MKHRIEIESTHVNQRNGSNDRGPWEIREQEAWLYLGDSKHSQRLVIPLQKGQAAYATGIYQLSEESLWVGRFNQLNVTPRLVPVAAAAPAARQAS